MGSKSRCKDVFTSKLASVQSLPLATIVDWTCWMANNWVPSIFSSESHTAGIAWEILANITMCSQVLHLMVALYGRIQILLPSLVTLWMVTQERGMIPLCATNIPSCAPLMSKEALVIVLRQLQNRNHCPGVCFLWSLKVTFATPRIVRISSQKARKGTLHEGLCAQKHLWLLKFYFSSNLRYF